MCVHVCARRGQGTTVTDLFSYVRRWLLHKSGKNGEIVNAINLLAGILFVCFQASERLLQSHGINSTILFLNNAPVGVVKIRFKEDEKRGEIYQGAKVKILLWLRKKYVVFVDYYLFIFRILTNYSIIPTIHTVKSKFQLKI